jgi:hypothetical protein
MRHRFHEEPSEKEEDNLEDMSIIRQLNIQPLRFNNRKLRTEADEIKSRDRRRMKSGSHHTVRLSLIADKDTARMPKLNDRQSHQLRSL